MNPCCRYPFLCTRHLAAHVQLTVLAKNFAVTDEQWHAAVARLDDNDLHLLLEEPAS